MRILQINNHEALGGGSERVYQSTTRMLLDRGHDVATLSCGDRSFDDRKLSRLLPRNGYVAAGLVATLRNARDFVYRPLAAEATRDLVREFRPQLAHLHIFYGQLSSSVLRALRAMDVPCVMTVHEYRMLCPVSALYTDRLGVCEHCAAGHPFGALRHRCNRDSIAASALSATEAWLRDRWFSYERHIDRFLMVSRFCLEKHVQYLPSLAAKSEVLYNFVDDDCIVARPAPVASDAPLLYAGRLSREKGVALLCDAISQRPDLRLQVAGTGPLDAELRARFGHRRNIGFLGRLDPPALRRAIAGARCCVVPSEWYENNPMSILESFAFGTPVIAADIGGIPELVQPGRTGWLFAPSDMRSLLEALDRAIATPAAERARMGQEGIELVRRRHGAQGHYRRLVAAYSGVLEARRRGRSPSAAAGISGDAR